MKKLSLSALRMQSGHMYAVALLHLRKGKTGDKSAVKAAENIVSDFRASVSQVSVADDRKVGIGHGNLAARLLNEETQCFAFLAGHESFAALKVLSRLQPKQIKYASNRFALY